MNGTEINQTKEGGERVHYRIEGQMPLWYMTLPKWGLWEKKKSNISRKGTETLFHGGADNLSPVF